MKAKDDFLPFFLIVLELEHIHATQVAAYNAAEAQWAAEGNPSPRFANWSGFRGACWRLAKSDARIYLVIAKVDSLGTSISKPFRAMSDARRWALSLESCVISNSIVARIYSTKTGRFDETANELDVIEI